MKNIKTDTIVRTVVLALALINQILSSTGHAVLPISDETVNTLITLTITTGAALWAWWKNNSVTKNAIAADQYLADLKTEASKVESETTASSEDDE